MARRRTRAAKGCRYEVAGKSTRTLTAAKKRGRRESADGQSAPIWMVCGSKKAKRVADCAHGKCFTRR